MKQIKRPGAMIIGIAFMLVLSIIVGGTNNLYAAEKIFDFKATNIKLNSSVEDSTVCGESGDFTVKTHVSKFRFASWDNGHSNLQVTFSSKTYDNEGKLIANVPVINRDQLLPDSDLTDSDFRFHSKSTVNAVCTGNSETPGKSESWLYSFSISFVNGELESIDAIAQPG